MAYRVSTNGMWAYWIGIGSALVSFAVIAAITLHTWASQFLCYG